MKISVILPAYNEEKRIGKTLDVVCNYMEENFTDYEILVVDDGSRDNTKEVAQNYPCDKLSLLSYGENRGKGGAVKHGILNSSGDIVVFTDSDLPYPVENIKKAADLLLSTSADFVLGTRKNTTGKGEYPLIRKLTSFGFSLMVRMIVGLNVSDTQCGFKAFSSACAKEIFKKTTICGWGFDVEAIFIAQKLGYKYKRLTVELFHVEEGSKINLAQDIVRMLGELFKIRKNNKNGLYD